MSIVAARCQRGAATGISYAGTRSGGEAVLRMLTEDELAAWRRAKGKRLARRRGRWWEEVKPGFYQAIHWMARQRQDEIERPTAFCWGFRTTLHDEDARAANGWLPAHVLCDPGSYDFDALPAKSRNKLRKCWKTNEIVEVIEPTVLRDQGYEIRCSVHQRTGMWRPPSNQEYVAGLDEYLGNRCRLVLAGLAEDRLRGYLDGFAVDGTAYIDHLYVHSGALQTEVGTGLVFAFVQACRRSGLVREVVYGLDVPSDQSLKQYKEKMGFPVVKIPARHWLLQPAGIFIRWWRPEVYYRLTGDADRLSV
ncbi:MAG TPA: GNAT family N-acetyltransferase [Geminicoccaceae bacterium]